jgi:hypothetical protein
MCRLEYRKSSQIGLQGTKWLIFVTVSHYAFLIVRGFQDVLEGLMSSPIQRRELIVRQRKAADNRVTHGAARNLLPALCLFYVFREVFAGPSIPNSRSRSPHQPSCLGLYSDLRLAKACELLESLVNVYPRYTTRLRPRSGPNTNLHRGCPNWCENERSTSIMTERSLVCRTKVRHSECQPPRQRYRCSLAVGEWKVRVLIAEIEFEKIVPAWRVHGRRLNMPMTSSPIWTALLRLRTTSISAVNPEVTWTWSPTSRPIRTCANLMLPRGGEALSSVR